MRWAKIKAANSGVNLSADTLGRMWSVPSGMTEAEKQFFLYPRGLKYARGH
jgi:hypothetical protein